MTGGPLRATTILLGSSAERTLMAKAPVRRLTVRRTASSSEMGWPDLAAAAQFLLDEVGDDFCIGLGYKFVALADELLLELEVVFDDAVVDDDEAAGAVAMGVGVLFGGAAVGGPAGVADAEGAVDGILVEDFFELAEFAGGATELEAVAIATDGDARRVVAAIFEAAQSLDDDGDDFRTVADVTDNAAHSFKGTSGVGGGMRRRKL